jgi:hypothetical protein
VISLRRKSKGLRSVETLVTVTAVSTLATIAIRNS